MLTILTDPVPYKKYFLKEILKRIIRFFFKYNNKRGFNKYLGGHFSVTRSLINGLNELGVNFVYNPFLITKVSDIVIVLSGVNTLKQAIYLKKIGRIKFLFAGPNIITFVNDSNNIISSNFIDYVITPSESTCNLYINDNHILKNKCKSWPAGVDINYWKPRLNKEKKKILFYLKQHCFKDTYFKNKIVKIDQYVNYLNSKKYQVELIEYGKFTKETYLKLLQDSILMVGFSFSESQGIAWAEAWATDVPTLIYYNNISSAYERIFSCETAPYLSPQTGQYFIDFEDFTNKFNEWETNQKIYNPSKWVLKNMSDKISASKLLEIINLKTIFT
jgi:hypothetical protein